MSAETGQFSRWGRGARLTRRVREEPPPGELARVYFDRNATQNAAKRSGSAGMDRRSNAAWVSPQAVKARRPPRSGKSAAPTLAGPRVMRAGFALPRDAGQRPALHKEKVRPRGAVAASGAGRVRRALGHGAVSCARVSRSRAMPVRDRRSTRKRRVPGERWRHPVRGGCGAHLGMAQCHVRGFRAPARCRSETGAPQGKGAASGSGGGIRCGEGAARTWAWRSVMCAGFALPRDAGQRPALHKKKARPRGAVAASGAGRGAARTWAWRSVMCAGFALPRDAGRRPALLVLQKRGRARRPAPQGSGLRSPRR